MGYHHVESGPASVSLNAWLPTKNQTAGLRTEVEALPLPFEEHWSLRQFTVALVIYCRDVIAHLALPQVITAVTQQYMALGVAWECSALDIISGDLQLVRNSSHARRATKVLEKLRYRGVGVLEMVTQSYIERLAEIFLGVENIGPFIRCLNDLK